MKNEKNMGNMGGFFGKIWEIWANFLKYGRKYGKYGRIECPVSSQTPTPQIFGKIVGLGNLVHHTHNDVGHTEQGSIIEPCFV